MDILTLIYILDGSNYMTKEVAINFLESLVHERMTIKQIKNEINAFFKTNKCSLVKSDIWWNEIEIPDYKLIGSTEDAYQENKKIPFCDYDIYVLPTKERIGKKIVYYITEVRYEFQ